MKVSMAVLNARELDKLREAYNSLNDIIRGTESAQHSMEALNFGMARDHLKAALCIDSKPRRRLLLWAREKPKG